MQEANIVVYLLGILKKWWKMITVVVIISGIVTSLIMLTKPNFYRSSTVFYPASTSIQKPVFTEAERNINYYGDDHDVDRMLSIATSSDTKRELIQELGLRDHYGLGDNEKSLEKLHLLFGKMYKVKKTEYDAIKITFEDTDREMTTKVANFAREKVDQKTQQIIKSAQANVLSNAENALSILQSDNEKLTSRLKEERMKYGVYNTDSQAEAFAIIESRGGNVKNKVKTYTEGISIVKGLEAQLEETNESLVKHQSNVYRLKSAMDSKISAMHVVQHAADPISKSGPFRSIFVLGAMLLMGVLSVLLIILIEASKVKTS